MNRKEFLKEVQMILEAEQLLYEFSLYGVSDNTINWWLDGIDGQHIYINK